LSISKKQLLRLFELVGDHKLEPQAALSIALGKTPFPEEPVAVAKPVTKKRPVPNPVVVDQKPEVVVVNLGTTVEEYPFSVDYGKPFGDYDKEINYDWVDHSRITATNFPASKTGRADYTGVLVGYRQDMTEDEIRHDLESRGLRAADAAELLAFGTAYSIEHIRKSKQIDEYNWPAIFVFSPELANQVFLTGTNCFWHVKVGVYSRRVSAVGCIFFLAIRK